MLKNISRDELLRYLLIVSIILIAFAAFALLCEVVAPNLATIVKFIGVIITPFAVAWLTAVITRPLTDWLSGKLHLPRTIAVLLMMLILLTVIVLLVMLCISVLSDIFAEVAVYFSEADQYLNDFIVYVTNVYERLNLDYQQLFQYFDTVNDRISGWAEQGLDMVFSVVSSTPQALVLILVMLVAIFYWCRDEKRVRIFLSTPFPAKRRESVLSIYDSISEVLGGYLRAQILLVSISTAICIIGFSVLGAGSPIAMGLFAGVMDIIPILGPGTIIVPWAVACIVLDKPGMAFGLIVVYALLTVSRNILEPKVVGDRIGLHPLAALAAIFIGMKMFGVVGLILGPITLSVIVAAMRARNKHKIINPGEQHKPAHEQPKLLVK
ncbi:MAG: sporulation integral membrane protein YtvI [Bacillota bacterium]|nr:sporulation integral membrane protein YtvI [Bacillota bacterium]